MGSSLIHDACTELLVGPFESGGEVGRVADHGVVVQIRWCAAVADDGRAGRDPHAQTDGWVVLVVQPVELDHGLLACQCGGTGQMRLGGLLLKGRPEGHDSIAEELVDVRAMFDQL